MVSALDSGSIGPGSSPSRVPYVVFLGKTLYSHSASLSSPSCTNGNPAMDKHKLHAKETGVKRPPHRPFGPV